MREKRKKLFGRQSTQEVMDAIGDDQPQVLIADVVMISGCDDHQTSADVSNVASFALPDPAGAAGGACTSTLLNILYKDEEDTGADLSFVEVLGAMRENLEAKGYTQIPQLTSTKELDLTHKFDLVPDGFEGTKRAVMVGINYVGHDPGELSGCHNDVGNMKNYIQAVHGFEEENITVLMDDGEHEEPTLANMLAAYRRIVEESQPGDSIFLHYSGHGSKLRDDNGDEDDGYDEVLCPIDYAESGFIRDDQLFEILVEGLPAGVHVVSLMDCCHSGTILDLPYKFEANGEYETMQLDEDFDWIKFGGAVGTTVMGILANYLDN